MCRFLVTLSSMHMYQSAVRGCHKARNVLGNSSFFNKISNSYKVREVSASPLEFSSRSGSSVRFQRAYMK